jgi:hypothetical protein
MADVSVNVTRQAVANGWGRAAWGDGGWNASITEPDISMTGAVGSTFVNADANVSGLSGVIGLKFVGEEEVVSNNNLSVTGFDATVGLGSISVALNNLVEVTGFSATSSLGSISAEAIANVTGVSSAMSLGNNLVWGQIDTAQTPNWEIIKEAA